MLYVLYVTMNKKPVYTSLDDVALQWYDGYGDTVFQTTISKPM